MAESYSGFESSLPDHFDHERKSRRGGLEIPREYPATSGAFSFARLHALKSERVFRRDLDFLQIA